MMLRLLVSLMFLTFFTACQVEENVSPSQQISSTNTTSVNYVVTLPTNGWKKYNDTIAVSLMLPYKMTVTGSPYIDVIIGFSSERLYYHSGSGSNVITFRYTVGPFDIDEDGIQFSNTISLNGGTISYLGAGGMSADVPLTYTVPPSVIKVDGVVPTVVSLTPPTGGNYVTGTQLIYDLAFSENVYVVGTPSFNLNMNSGSVAAEYFTGSGTDTIKFRRYVAVTDSDTTGFTSGTTLTLNSPTITIKDQAGNVFNSSIPASITADKSSSGNIYTGAGAPAAGLGSNGDAYFNSTTGASYLKSSGVWATSTNTLINVTVPTITSVSAPAGGTYTTGNNLDFTVTWSQAVNVTGSPGIKLILTTGSVYASYLSGSGTATHVYRYTVQSGNVDFDGISIDDSIDPRGGTIKNTTGTQSATMLFTQPSTSTILVDAGVGPAVVDVDVPANGYYLAGQNLDFSLSFNQNVIVTGTPRIPVLVGSTTAYANYISGTGTSSLVFRYTVSSPHSDDDGISLLSPIDLNGGDIEDASAKNAILAFSIPATSLIKVDALAPTIVSVTPQTAGTFRPGDAINFQVLFSENVAITGTPRIALTVGSTTYYANYISGTGTSLLTFRYTVSTGHLDTDGITLTSPIDLNTGTIADARGNAAILTYVPAATLINVDGVASTISSITPPANMTYAIGSNIDFVVNWDEPVQIIGNPRIQLTVGTASVFADFTSVGSTSTTSRFRYTVVENDLDTNGIVSAATLQLNGGQIKDYSGNIANITFAAPTLTSVLVDGVRPAPTLSAATPVAGWFINGSLMTFNITWPESVTIVGVPKLNLQIGAATAVANYVAGSSTPTSSVFTYTVAPGNQDLDGIVVVPTIFLAAGVTIQDAAGNNAKIYFAAPNFAGVKVDALDPSVSNIQVPASGTYNLYDNLYFTVTFNEPVTVSGGTPRIHFKTGTSSSPVAQTANYISGSGNTLTFRYTVGNGHLDTDGIELTNPFVIDLNGATIADAVNNLADTSGELLFVPGSTSGILIDGVRPIIMSVSPPASGMYTLGMPLDFQLTFSDVMTVTGTPRIQININGNLVWANYLTGTGTSVITFRYSVSGGDESYTGVAFQGGIDLNGGDLQDPSTNTVNTYYATVNYSGVQVDAKAPDFFSGWTDNHGYSSARPNIDFKLLFTEPIFVSTAGGTPSFPINIAGTNYNATYYSGSGTSTLVFRYSLPTASETLDLDGITVTPTISLNGGTMFDTVGYAAPLAFTWTKKVYAYYKNMIARYNFDVGNRTTTPCGPNQCITSVTNIGDLTSPVYGNLANSTYYGPVLGSNFSTTSKFFAQYNDSNFLRLPGTAMTNVKYVTVVIRADNDMATSTIIPELYFVYASNTRQLRASVDWVGRNNLGTTNGVNSYYGYFYEYYQYTVGGYHFYHMDYASLRAFSAYTAIGSNNFDGQIAEIIFWNNNHILTSGQIDNIRNQLDAMYNVYP